MARPLKRSMYVSDTDSSSWEDGDSDTRKIYEKYRKLEGKAKCSSRNAILARENRIKKKLYMQKLEREVKVLKKNSVRLNFVIQNQSCKITELKKRVSYMKSVLANSSDLRVLMKNIQCNTGLSVATSLDKSLCYPDVSPKSSSDLPLGNTSSFWDDQLCLSDFKPETWGFETNSDEPTSDKQVPTETCNIPHKEHNYTLKSDEDDSIKDVGVCLHVSKHRVSLEFCSSCSETASETWKTFE